MAKNNILIKSSNKHKQKRSLKSNNTLVDHYSLKAVKSPRLVSNLQQAVMPNVNTPCYLFDLLVRGTDR